MRTQTITLALATVIFAGHNKTNWRGRLILLLAALPLPAAGAQCDGLWEPRLLQAKAKANSGRVELRDNRGAAVATLSITWLIAVNHINKRINAVSGIDAQFLLCNSPHPNAFAGYDRGRPFVALTLGMQRLLAKDWPAYAAILGHENAHLVRRHGRKRQNRETVSALGKSLLGRYSGSPLAAKSLKLGALAITSSYSREEEHEADRDGMRYAHEAGYNPCGALSFHTKMKSAKDFLSSHPSSADRIRRLKAESKKNGWGC